MDSYKAFKAEALDVERIWQITSVFEGCNGFRKIYIKKLIRIRLACRVLTKLSTYRKSQLEAIKIIPEDLPENNIHTINTIGTSLKPNFSLKIQCKIQISDWTLKVLEKKSP